MRLLVYGLLWPAVAAGLLAAPGCGPAEERNRSAPIVRADEAAEPGSEDLRPSVLFLGTSLTAGLGVAPEEAYPALIQRRIDAAGLEFHVVNAGVSGDTSAGGLNRLAWLLRQPVRVLFVELGANDMLRGQDPASLRSNLQAIIDRTRERFPEVRVVIAGMQAAPNLGRRYAREFAAVYTDLARRNDATLVPFLLEGVAGVPGLNQADGIHPTPEGHRRIADTVWKQLDPVLRVLTQ